MQPRRRECNPDASDIVAAHARAEVRAEELVLHELRVGHQRLVAVVHGLRRLVDVEQRQQLVVAVLDGLELAPGAALVEDEDGLLAGKLLQQVGEAVEVRRVVGPRAAATQNRGAVVGWKAPRRQMPCPDTRNQLSRGTVEPSRDRQQEAGGWAHLRRGERR